MFDVALERAVFVVAMQTTGGTITGGQNQAVLAEGHAAPVLRLARVIAALRM